MLSLPSVASHPAAFRKGSLGFKNPTSAFQPTIELQKPVWEVDPFVPYCTVTGEIELDTTIFGDLQYSIGLSLSSNDGTRIDWNQDGPGNYYRPRSYIKIHPRLVVDHSCFVKVTLYIPSEFMPATAQSCMMTLGMKAYALDDPFIATKPVSVSFMLLNKTARAYRA